MWPRGVAYGLPARRAIVQILPLCAVGATDQLAALAPRGVQTHHGLAGVQHQRAVGPPPGQRLQVCVRDHDVGATPPAMDDVEALVKLLAHVGEHGHPPHTHLRHGSCT
eukprot:CAMPEP_0204060006 /NCGR_PEP_ID=MMETSP0360-20130528/139046_1 /ASSEMBLY_ACC=CAM_ASM_000342 /TAXON_ID=268821 /ORGANISM="Scrippsiella Hangoei, Strain SHTV-5" /LENGTH=108 /DNA_ID=CAMNT_0051007663 /DNA_START=179 /DNA_END=502 /DNA_ORIENTATION=+